MTATRISLTAPPEVFRKRRARVAEALARPLAVFAGHAPARNYASNPHRFRAGSSYLYFGGPPLEHAAWLIEPGSDGDSGCTLFRVPSGPDDALWFGEIPGDGELTAVAGISRSNVADVEQIGERLRGRETGAVVPPFVRTIAQAQQLGCQPAVADELLAIINMRLYKDEHELEAMRSAAEVAVEAHRAALAVTEPGGHEADVAAAYTTVLVANSCDHSYNPIITIRGEVLHAHGHTHKLASGALLLADAGAEEPGGYATDITRTWPVSGKWTGIQRRLYDTVERALQTAVEACIPGTRYRQVHELAARTLCAGLVDAKLLRGDVDSLVERRAHALFFPHGVGHLIGLDVHDMEDFGDLAGYAPGRARSEHFGDRFLRLDRDLAEGMCVTVEPGIYFVPAIWANEALAGPYADCVNRAEVDKLLEKRFGGIRVEHTVCIRGSRGPEILTAALPTAADEIAGLVGAG